jgi:hypothetical protein
VLDLLNTHGHVPLTFLRVASYHLTLIYATNQALG